jgi:hypothetical protein
MTALVFIRRDDGLIVASDGAIGAQDGSGTVLGLRSKVLLIPEWSTIIGFRGHVAVKYEIHRDMHPIRSFDEFVDGIALELEVVIARLSVAGVVDPHGTLFFGGWSDRAQAFESYRVGSREREIHGGKQEEEIIAPYTLTPLAICHAAPAVPSSLYQKFGIDFDCKTAADEQNLALRLVCAARADDSSEDSKSYPIGGFLQLSVAARDFVQTATVHRWPDVIGARVDLTLGEAMPAFLEKKSSKTAER